MSTSLFVYGTLMLPEVIYELTGKRFLAKNAELDNYARYKIYDGNKAKVYPAIVEQKGIRVQGKLISGVDNDSLAKIDFFEDNTYIKKNIIVKVGGIEESALAYIWPLQAKRQLAGNWGIESFKNKHLGKYINNIKTLYSSIMKTSVN